jgi:hypothetical protein
VILGDLRYFLLLERHARAPGDASARTPAAAFVAATAWSLVVPVFSFGTSRAMAHAFADPRSLFLLYEVAFVLLGGAYSFVWFPRRMASAPDEVKRWLRGVARFELALYIGWALADVVIMAGHDVGFAARLIPNVMYYALFLPFVLWTAPSRVRP